ncbi:MAG TPA: 30S ribosomal protein S8 [Candidatus Woesebacteria bacterium]|nr:30S ribosomal protein S8 [Candidatus Woesebacteria bacterium]
MLITDPIGDMLSRIRNALMSGQPEVKMPHSKLKEAVALKLKEDNYVTDVLVNKQTPQNELVVVLRYVDGVPAITGLERISKPGRRLYSSKDSIPSSLNGFGITIVSTNKGVISDKEAKKLNVGGELICKVW